MVDYMKWPFTCMKEVEVKIRKFNSRTVYLSSERLQAQVLVLVLTEAFGRQFLV